MSIIKMIDFRNGVVEHNEFSIDFSQPFEDQIDELREDLLQVRYLRDGNAYVVDVGWYPESQFHDGAGLMIFVVVNQDWTNPIFRKKCRTEREFLDVINEAIDMSSQKKTLC